MQTGIAIQNPTSARDSKTPRVDSLTLAARGDGPGEAPGSAVSRRRWFDREAKLVAVRDDGGRPSAGVDVYPLASTRTGTRASRHLRCPRPEALR